MASKYGFTFDPFKLTGVKVPASKRDAALEAVGNYLLESSLMEIGAGRSPVAGGPWKKSLTPEYKKKKADESSVTFANAELSGDLLDHLDVVPKGRTKLFIGVDGDRENAGKLEGNNIGSYGRDPDESVARRIVPLEGETFKPSIVQGMKEVLEGFVDD